jgi:hypothetical protein
MDKQDLTRVMSNDLDLGQNLQEKTSNKRAREETPQKTKKQKKRKIQPEEVEDEIDDLEVEESLEGIKGSVAADPIPRRKKIQKIEAWFATFPTKLEKIRENVDLESMSEVQLDSLQLEIKQVIGSNGAGAMGEMVPLAGLTLYESILVSCGINVQGISNLAFDPNFKQACQEVMLEFSDMTYVPPHYRILFYIGNASWHLHEKNSANTKNNNPTSQVQNTAQEGRKGEDQEMMEAGKNYQASKNS